MENLALQKEFRDKLRNELIDGKIVAMSPATVNHIIVAGNIFNTFKNFLRGKPCIPFTDGVLVSLTEKDKVIPDVVVVCNNDIIKRNGIYGAPDLIVEVLSPGTAKKDKGYKKNLYEKCGVKEYWIVEIETRSIEVYLLENNKFTLDEVYSVFPDYLLEATDDGMMDEEKAAIKCELTPSMFPDMRMKLEDVFESKLF